MARQPGAHEVVLVGAAAVPEQDDGAAHVKSAGREEPLKVLFTNSRGQRFDATHPIRLS